MLPLLKVYTTYPARGKIPLIPPIHSAIPKLSFPNQHC